MLILNHHNYTFDEKAKGLENRVSRERQLNHLQVAVMFSCCDTASNEPGKLNNVVASNILSRDLACSQYLDLTLIIVRKVLSAWFYRLIFCLKNGLARARENWMINSIHDVISILRLYMGIYNIQKKRCAVLKTKWATY